MIDIPPGVDEWPIIVRLQEEPAYCHQIEPAEKTEEPRFTDIRRYLEKKTFPKDATATDRLQRLASQYVISGGVFYKRSHDHILLRCVNEKEAEAIMTEMHEGICGPHMNGHAMAKKIIRQGYYWPTMEKAIYRANMFGNASSVRSTAISSTLRPPTLLCSIY